MRKWFGSIPVQIHTDCRVAKTSNVPVTSANQSEKITLAPNYISTVPLQPKVRGHMTYYFKRDTKSYYSIFAENFSTEKRHCWQRDIFELQRLSTEKFQKILRFQSPHYFFDFLKTRAVAIAYSTVLDIEKDRSADISFTRRKAQYTTYQYIYFYMYIRNTVSRVWSPSFQSAPTFRKYYESICNASGILRNEKKEKTQLYRNATQYKLNTLRRFKNHVN